MLILKVFILAVIIVAVIAITLFIDKYFKLSEIKIIILLIILGILGFLGGLFAWSKIIDSVDLGGIKGLYIFKTEKHSQLTVWFTRIHNAPRIPGVCYYDQRLTTFNMNNGKILNNIEMSKKDTNHDYRILQISRNFAWGFSNKTGLQLLDMQKPELVADKNDILLQNNEIGDYIKLYHDDYVIDPVTKGIHIQTKEYKTYRVGTDLKIHKANERLLKKSYIYNENLFQYEWIYSFVNANTGKKIYKKGFQLSDDSVILLKSEFIDELNPKSVTKNKIWIKHKSAIYDNYDLLLSLIDTKGRELAQINLFKYFKNKKIHILGTYTQNKEVLIFIGIGKTHLADIKGFTLFALKTDPNTGKIIDKIKYF
jgi:hypothetical protein